MAVQMMEIPAFARITHKVSYQVLWVDAFVDPYQIGGCDSEKKQITILRSLSKRKAFSTFVHEVFHAMSFEKNIELTESQVESLEAATMSFLRLNKIT